jgi:hypothetical protein
MTDPTAILGSQPEQLPRREFIKRGVAATAAIAATTDLPAALAETNPREKMMGIQVGAVSFVDEGTEKVLDSLQEMAGINTLFVATFTYGRGIAGRPRSFRDCLEH